MELEPTEIVDKIKSKIVQIKFDTIDTSLKLDQIKSEQEKADLRIKQLIQDLDYESRVEWVEYHRIQGNQYIKGNKFEQWFKSLNEYYLAILALNDQNIWKQYGVNLISNVQVVLEQDKLNKPLTEELLLFALELEKQCPKTYWRLGKYYKQTQQKDKARKYLLEGKEICQKTNDISSIKEFDKELYTLR